MARPFNQGPTVRGPRVELDLPFPGFYGSTLDGMLDRSGECEVEGFIERQREECVPQELCIDRDTYAQTLFEAQDCSPAFEMIARDWAQEYGAAAERLLGFKLGFRYALTVSPREYNFSTDRLFVTISKTVRGKLFRMSKADDHMALAAVIAERFTSYDGFSSSYNNDLASWLDVPLADWDENEIGTLFRACLAIKLAADGQDVAEGMRELAAEVEDALGNADWQYFEASIDWPKLDRAVADKRDEMAAEHRASVDPDYVVPTPRCPDTLDLFAGH